MEPLFIVRDVELVHRTDLVLLYRIGGQEARVSPLQVKPGSVTVLGQRGELIIPKWLAEELGLDGSKRY